VIRSKILVRPYSATPDLSPLAGGPRIPRAYQLRLLPYPSAPGQLGAFVSGSWANPPTLIRADSGGEGLVVPDATRLKFQSPPHNGWALAPAAIPAALPDLWLAIWADEPGDELEPVPGGGVNTKGGALVTIQNSDKITCVQGFNLNPTAAMDLFGLMSATTGRLGRLRRIVITNPGQQTTAGLVTLQLMLASSLGSGGSTPSSRSMGYADGNPGQFFTCHIGDTTPASNPSTPNFHPLTLWVPAAAGPYVPWEIDFGGNGQWQAPGVGTSPGTGVVLRHPGSAGAANFCGFVEWTEEYLAVG